MLQIRVYNSDKSSLVTILTEFNNLQINKNWEMGGSATFDVDINEKVITMDNFRKYNRVIFFDGITNVFSGYISSWNFNSQKPDTITVTVSSAMTILKKRLTDTADNYTGVFGDSILSIITQYGGDIGITAGTNTTSETGQLEFNRENVASAIQKLADIGNIEYYLDENDVVQVRKTMGSVLSTKLRFSESQNNINNIISFNFLSDGTPIYNRIVGTAPSLTGSNAVTYAKWLFNEGTGSTLYDSSGNERYGTLINSPAWIVYKDGYALNFDRVSAQYIDLGSRVDDLDGATAFTIMFEARLTTVANGLHGGIFCRGGSTATASPWLFSNAGSAVIRFLLSTTSTIYDIQLATPTIIAGEWGIFAFTWDGTNAIGYKNWVATAPDTSVEHAMAGSLGVGQQIGRIFTGGAHYLDGDIARMIVLKNESLTLAEMQERWYFPDPLLEKTQYFSEAKTQGDLDLLIDNALDRVKEEREIPNIVIDTDKIDPYLIGLGDTVSIFISKGQLLNIDDDFRIVAIQYNYSDTGQPEVTLSFSDPTSKSLSPSLGKDIQAIQGRVNILENS